MTAPLPVTITPNAADDLTALWVWRRDRNSRAADEWLAGIRNMILALGAILGIGILFNAITHWFI